jgi:hypothetical protein
VSLGPATSTGTVTSTICLWRPPGGSIPVFARAGVDAVEARLAGVSDLQHATVHATRVSPPGFALVPFRSVPIALVTLRGAEPAIARARDALRTLPGRLEAWSTATSVPVTRQSVPGAAACLLTLFRKARHVDGPTFLRRWHDEHTPMTLEIHPVTGYVRHVVTASLEPGSAPWDGIVTEDFAALEDLTTLRLFGRGPRALYNAVRIARHVPTFLDLRTIETYLVEERALR